MSSSRLDTERANFTMLQKYADLSIDQVALGLAQMTESQHLYLAQNCVNKLLEIGSRVNTLPKYQQDELRALLTLLRVDESLQILANTYNYTMKGGDKTCGESCVGGEGTCGDDCPLCHEGTCVKSIPETSIVPASSSAIAVPSGKSTEVVLSEHRTQLSTLCIQTLRELSSNKDSQVAADNVMAITARSTKELNERIKELDRQIEEKNKELSDKREKYEKKMMQAFEDARTKDTSDLSTRRKVEGVAAVSGGIVGGTVAHSFASGTTALIKTATASVANWTMRRTAELTTFLGASLFECSQRLNEGWMSSYTGTEGYELVTPGTFYGVTRTPVETCPSSLSEGQTCEPAQTMTCSNWQGIDINDYGNITLVATTAGVLLSGIGLWAGTRVIKGETSLVEPGIIRGSVTAITGALTLGTTTVMQTLLPSTERSNLEQRVREGRHFAGPEGQLVSKAEVLKNLSSDFEKSEQYKSIKEEIETLRGEKTQLTSELTKFAREGRDAALDIFKSSGKRESQLQERLLDVVTQVASSVSAPIAIEDGSAAGVGLIGNIDKKGGKRKKTYKRKRVNKKTRKQSKQHQKRKSRKQKKTNNKKRKSRKQK